MAVHRFTRRAEQDLLDIFLYGLETFGLRQAESYRDGLAACFALLAERSDLGRSCPEIGENLRRHQHASHVVLYEPVAAGVLIVAVAHGRAVRRLMTLDD